ncbi:FAD binding domain-containing protein [Colletotrichum abscissum]|uniref:FAD binding domain-containing protein n=2 Tax=Colletotrichum abscissum TaxID=1671311 RepID=A0A9P9XE29_9PEZI|nr:FAD binding domain-containing protein [Colletotrichum abscissum]
MPDTSEAMGHAVKELSKQNVPFAVRGGGWMPVPGAANINSSGVLLSTQNLTGLELSDDGTSVSVASGHDWSDVYKYLSPHGLTAVGSRIGVVGVPGFLLGGGMSFLSNEHGWGSANVIGYKVVLACGSVVYVTATNDYSDLFWALRGGGNSFAIVTRFDLKTVEAAEVAVGSVGYGAGQRDSFIKNLFDFSQNGVLDQRAFVLPTISFVPAASSNITYSAKLFYNGANDTTPGSLADFLPPKATSQISSTFSIRTMANWTAESDEGFDRVHGQNFRFHGFTILANLDTMYEAHDTFFNYAKEHGTGITGFIATLAMNPIAKSFLVNNRGEDPAGDPMGVNADAGPYFMCEQTFSWSFKNETELMTKLIAGVNSELEVKLAGVLWPFVPLNNAGDTQDVFSGYDSTNVERLNRINKKYDPHGTYTRLMIGGLKL